MNNKGVVVQTVSSFIVSSWGTRAVGLKRLVSRFIKAALSTCA